MTIRPANRADLTAIVALWRELQETNATFDPRLAMGEGAADWFRDFLRDQLDNAGAAVFVAVEPPDPSSPLPGATAPDSEGEGPGVRADVIGYAFGQILRRPTLQSGDCGYVADLCVHADRRGQGIGRQLYQRLRRWFADARVTAIEVQVVRANPASQAFWRKMGFDDFLRTLRADL